MKCLYENEILNVIHVASTRPAGGCHTVSKNEKLRKLKNCENYLSVGYDLKGFWGPRMSEEQDIQE